MTVKLKLPSLLDVFNTSHRIWGRFSMASTHAYESGYKYIIWNGWVYRIDQTVNEPLEQNRICTLEALIKGQRL